MCDKFAWVSVIRNCQIRYLKCYSESFEESFKSVFMDYPCAFSPTTITEQCWYFTSLLKLINCQTLTHYVCVCVCVCSWKTAGAPVVVVVGQSADQSLLLRVQWLSKGKGSQDRNVGSGTADGWMCLLGVARHWQLHKDKRSLFSFHSHPSFFSFLHIRFC